MPIILILQGKRFVVLSDWVARHKVSLKKKITIRHREVRVKVMYNDTFAKKLTYITIAVVLLLNLVTMQRV